MNVSCATYMMQPTVLYYYLQSEGRNCQPDKFLEKPHEQEQGLIAIHGLGDLYVML